MSTISVNNNYSSNSIYTTSKNNNSKLSSLIKERESLQEEIQSLQKELTSKDGNESETLQAQIESLQSEITNIDSQIAKVQAEKNNDNLNNNSSSESDNKFKYPSVKLDNSRDLNNALSKLDENIKILENEITLNKARGINTENKDKVLSNIKNNIKNINSKLEEVGGDESKVISEDIELVGNFVDSEA